jgi:hypothetical protein
MTNALAISVLLSARQRAYALVATVAFLLVCLAPHSASALSTTIKVDARSTLGDQADFSFEVSVEAHSTGDQVAYTVTNNGADWPRHTLIGVFPAFGLGVIANQRVKLKSGESYTLRGEVLGKYAGGLEFRINADWINQDFVMRGMPSPRPSIEQAQRNENAPTR